MNTPANPLGLATPTEAICHNEVRTADIAIVGEAPGQHEVEQKQPFVGGSGRLLWALLAHHGITRQSCAVLNVSQHQPPGNNFDAFDWDGPEVQGGLAALDEAMEVVQPKVVFCLGNAALCAARNGTPTRLPNGTFKWPWSIKNWTGSVFYSERWSRKGLACLHPAAILRNYNWRLFLVRGCQRLAEERHTTAITLPDYRFYVQAELQETLRRLRALSQAERPITMDIEGGLNTLSCISFATSGGDAFIVPFTKPDGSSYWSVEDEVLIWDAVAAVISNPAVPKVLQNYLYDSMVLAYGYRTPIFGLADDTMVKHWELLPEFEKALEVQASLYTKQPYWKDARSTTGHELWQYCCTDSAVTFACNVEQERQLAAQPLAARHYKLNLDLLPAMLYMQLRGIAYDSKLAAELLRKLNDEIYEAKHLVDRFVVTYWPTSSAEAVQIVAQRCCKKRAVVLDADDLLDQPLKAYHGTIGRLADIARRWPDVTQAEQGFFTTQVELGINVDSPKQMVDLLYNQWKLPKQFKKIKGRRTNVVTADQLALLDLYVKTKDERLMQLLRLRGKIDQRKELQVQCDPDGRARTALNLVGQETGRISSYTSITGSGGNLTTVPKQYRRLYVAG